MAAKRRDKPPFNAWVQAERIRMGWKVEELSDRLKAMGVEAEPPTVRGWEGFQPGKPRQSTIDALERLFGSRAPEEDDPDAALLSAIRAQTEAISQQADLSRQILETAQIQMKAMEEQNQRLWAVLQQLAEVQLGAVGDEVAQLARELAEGRLDASQLDEEPGQSPAAGDRGSPGAARDR